VTASRANRINGYEHVQTGPKTWAALDEKGEVVASASHRKPTEAIRQVVELVYARNRNIAMERDGWKCVRCGSFRNLQAHHKVERGMGGANRLDEPSNLETLCCICHAKVHGG
jgi:5-methylcytosine-specific restriction endonuclease McrA